MTYFPTNVMKNILAFCDDSIEREQKRLWNSIKIDRWQRDGCECEYEACTDRYKTIRISWDINGDEWNEIENWAADPNGACLIETLEDDEYWKNAMNNTDYAQHRHFKLSNFTKRRRTKRVM